MPVGSGTTTFPTSSHLRHLSGQLPEVRRTPGITTLALPGVLLTGTPAHAAAPAATTGTSFTAYLCDGNGVGSCRSITPGITPAPGEQIFGIGESSGAWRWDFAVVGYVNSTTFTDGYIDNALNNQPIYDVYLHGQSIFCNGNTDGGDWLKSCDGSASELWVRDPANGYFVNVGRSNEKDNWEVLCNPGGHGQLVIGTRDSCATYHEEWNFS
jgi:hypothetical protein